MILRRYLKVLASSVPSDEHTSMYAAEVDMILIGADFADAVAAHVGLGSGTQERLARDEGLCRFQQMLKCSKVLSTATLKVQNLEPEEGTTETSDDFNWGAHAAKSALVHTYRGLLASPEMVDAINFRAAALSEATTQAIQGLQEVSKEYYAGNENSWRSTVPDKASLEIVLETAKATLETLNLEGLERSLKLLSQASPDWGWRLGMEPAPYWIFINILTVYIYICPH